MHVVHICIQQTEISVWTQYVENMTIKMIYYALNKLNLLISPIKNAKQKCQKNAGVLSHFFLLSFMKCVI